VAKKLPYYPMFVDEFDLDEKVIAMNLSEVGLYLLSLNSAWRYGSIPDDPIGLNQILRKNLNEVKKAWPVVRQRFVPSTKEHGRLVNRRQEIERVRALDKSQKASNAGSSPKKRKSENERQADDEHNSEPTLSGCSTNDDRPFTSFNGDDQRHASCLFSSTSQSKSSSSEEEGLGEGGSAVAVTESDLFEEFIGVFLAAGVKLNERDMQKAGMGSETSPGFLSFRPAEQRQIVDFVTEKAKAHGSAVHGASGELHRQERVATKGDRAHSAEPHTHEGGARAGRGGADVHGGQMTRADDCAAMRKELVVLREALEPFECLIAINSILGEWPMRVKMSEARTKQIQNALDVCPIAAELSKKESV
jgi:uncharacterized protein YdaU (DUF1376 family)